MLGLWISRDGSMTDDELMQLLAAQLIPLAGLTDAPAFAPEDDRDAFLRQASCAVLLGQPVPMAGIARHLAGPEALAGNVLRKYVCLQLSLAPYLRRNAEVAPLEGCFLVGQDLLIVPMGRDGCIDALLPDGVWTELATGECMTGRLRRIRGLNALPVLARENSVIPIGVDDRTPNGDDADRVTLHWFQPKEEAHCLLADGTAYHLTRQNGGYAAQSSTQKLWHVIVHQDGEEMLVK